MNIVVKLEAGKTDDRTFPMTIETITDPATVRDILQVIIDHEQLKANAPAASGPQVYDAVKRDDNPF